MRGTISRGEYLRAAVQHICGRCPVSHPLPAQSTSSSIAPAPRMQRRYASSSGGQGRPTTWPRPRVFAGSRSRSEDTTRPPHPGPSLLDTPDTPRRSRAKLQVSSTGRLFVDDPDPARRSRPAFVPGPSFLDDPDTPRRSRSPRPIDPASSDGSGVSGHPRTNALSRGTTPDGPPARRHAEARPPARHKPLHFQQERPVQNTRRDERKEPALGDTVGLERGSVDRERDSQENPRRSAQNAYPPMKRRPRSYVSSTSRDDNAGATLRRDVSPRADQPPPDTMQEVLSRLDSEAQAREAIKLGPRALPLEELMDRFDGGNGGGDAERPEDEDPRSAAQSAAFRQLADGLSPDLLGVTTPPAARRVNAPADALQDTDPVNAGTSQRARTTKSHAKAPAPSILSDPSRHLGRGVDLSALPKATRESPGKSSRVVGWGSVDYRYATPKLFSREAVDVRNANFHLRAFPVGAFPPAPAPPFPPQFLPKRTESKVVTFGYMATKAKISNFAVVRNRAVRRLKYAVDLVVNRGVALGKEENGWDLVSDEFMYMAAVEKSILDVPMELLCDQTASLLKDLRRKCISAPNPRARPPSRYHASRPGSIRAR